MSTENIDNTEQTQTQGQTLLTDINEWEDLSAKTELLRGIYASGFEKLVQSSEKQSFRSFPREM